MTLSIEVTPINGVLNCIVEVPGSKSITNRALVCAALASGGSQLSHVATGDDTAAMIDALAQLGAVIERNGDEVRLLSPLDLSSTQELTLNARLAGTTARFLLAVAALRSGPTVITGEPALLRRPMRGLLEALNSLGVGIEPLGEQWHLPVRIIGNSDLSSEVSLAADVSSQFVTALMLIGPCVEGGLVIRLSGRVVSQPYIGITGAVMRSFGASVEIAGDLVTVGGGGYRGRAFSIEPDASSASYPLAAAAIVGGQVHVRGISADSSQGDSRFASILSAMGCGIVFDDSGVTILRDKDTPLRGIEIDMSDFSDLVPTLAVVAMFAVTPTSISGVGFIRAKESDRLDDLAQEMRKLGGVVEVMSDGLEIRPSLATAGKVETHHDHRLAMALALVGLARRGVVISDPQVVSKSWPNYFQEISKW